MESKETFWGRMFNKFPAELQDLVWHHAAENAGPQMLYLDVEQLQHLIPDERDPNTYGQPEPTLDDEYIDMMCDYIDKEKLDAKLLNRKRLGDATRAVRSLGRVCSAARKKISQAYPNVLGLRFRIRAYSYPRWTGFVRQGPPDGTESLVPEDYYALRINGKRDLCVLAVSEWRRQTYALRNADITVVPKCIRHLGLDLDTLFDNRNRRQEEEEFGFQGLCACLNGLPDEDEFPRPTGAETGVHPGGRGHPVVCPSEPLVPFLKALKHVETVVLVGVCDPLLALAEPALVDSKPYSRRVKVISSWEDADELAQPDTPLECTRAFDGKDSYAFIPVWPSGDEEDSPPPVLVWIRNEWRKAFPYLDYLPDIKFRIVRRETGHTVSELRTFFRRPRFPIAQFGNFWWEENINWDDDDWYYERLYHDLSDDEAEGEGEEKRFRSYSQNQETRRQRRKEMWDKEAMMRDVPCIFDLQEWDDTGLV